MSAELIKELHEGNERLARILERLRRAQGMPVSRALLAELRGLEKDDEDENNGDWTR